MKCSSCQNLLDEGSKFCPHCGEKVLNAPSIVLCPGTPENPCGAELQESFKFCKECGTVVDQSLFGKKKEVCINCGNAFTKDGEKFCAQCGTSRQGKSDGRTKSPVEIEKRPSDKVDDDDSSAVVQIQKSGATSLKSGQLASSNSTDSSKANDKGKKSKNKKKKKRKKNEALDNDKKEDQKHQEEKKKGKKSEAHDNDKKEDQKHQEENKKGKKSEAHDNDKKEDQKHQEEKKKGKKSEAHDNDKKEDQKHQEEKKKGKKSEAHDNDKKEDQKHQEEKKKGKKSEAHDNDKKEDQKHQEEKKKGKKSEAHDNDKKEDQKHQEKIKDIEEKGVNASQIKTSTGLSSEKEDILEATQYLKVQMNAKPEAEKMGSDANTDSSAENKNEKRSSLEEAEVNYTDQPTNQETKQDAATPSAEGKEEIWKSDQSSSANLQTDDSAKLDKSQMNENANNDKPDQKSVVLPKKSQGRNKNESAEMEVQNVTTQKTGGKSSSSCKIGVQGIKTDAVRVHFHAIISPEFGLEDKDKVIVKFGEEKLGGWESNEHKCTFVRYMEDDYMEFELHMNIPKEIFYRNGKRIEYKYVVLKDGVKKNPKYVWENYCTQYAQDTNRNIAMKDNQSAMDDWHQYDGVVYPKVQDEGFLKKNLKKLKRYFLRDNPERHKEDLKLSLLCFQPKLFKDFSSGQKLLVPVDETIMQLDQLKHCMRKVYYADRKCFSSETEYEQQITAAILVPVLQSFENLPLKDWMESTDDAQRRMIKAIAVLSALGSLHLKLEQDEQDLLARGLFVRPNQSNRKCYDLESIDRFVTKDKKRHLGKFLKTFIEGMTMTAKDHSIFLCMPLYHFLTDEVQPFEKVPYDTSHDSKDQKWWGVSSLVGAVSRFKTVQSWKVPLEEVLSILHPLFEMDYLLPRTFMAILKLEEVEVAIKTGMIPIDVSAATLIYYLKQNSPNYFQKEKLFGSALHTLRDLSGKVKVTDESSNTDFIKLQMFCKIAADLVSETLLSSTKILLVSAVQIFLLAAANYDIMKRNQDSLESDTLQQFDHYHVLSKLYEDVKMWQLKHQPYKYTLESFLEDWNSIFAPTDLPSEDVRQAWNLTAMKDLSDLLTGAIERDASIQRALIDLYCSSTDNFHPAVQNCLSQFAFQVIETSYSVTMHQQGERERQRFGALLSSFYQREWEAALKKGDMEADRIILHHILTWTPFSYFLKMFYGDERKIYLLSDNCSESLIRAISVIEDRIETLDNGNITIQDLTLMKKAHDKFQELALIISEKSESVKPRKIFDTVKALEVRQIEVDSYNKQMKYVTTLTQLCQHIVTVDLGAIDSKMKHLANKKDHRVCEICQPANVETVILNNFHPKITAFELADEVASMLEPLQKLYESNIFINLWSEIGRQAKFKSQSASLEEVCEKVWKPVSAKMEEITWKLETGEIQFVEMEKYLGNIYRDDYGKMVSEMTFIKVPKEQADERIKQLMQFRQLETCFEGAKAINDIVEAYGLKGDFNVIKTIMSQKHAAKMKMKEFDDSILDTCAFLQDFTLEKTQCLNVFIECKGLVLWLQESLKGGLKELKVFVDLASISAGDGPMDIARVNCLHAAITGFAPLIFDLDENSGYKELLEKCQILWKELKADPNLPKKLRDTQRHLEWLKTVKQAHGSVEVTSLAQAEAINSKGIFLVGALDSTGETSTVLNLNSTLRLTVPDPNKDIKGHRNYTFDQLQDLQSRLMLVAGKAERGKDDIDRFMLVSESVLRLANIFIKLNSAGCVLFRHWKTEFFCEPDRPVCALIMFGQGAKPFKGKRADKKDLTEVIPKIAGFMERCLEKWKDHIAKKRLEYFELNYFTTDQLVILQQELVKVTSDQFPNIRIYPLLSAVKENCTHEDLVDAMRKALTDIENVQSELDKEKELDAQENEQVKLDEKEDEEEVQIFIRAMIAAKYSEKLARAALKHHKPSEIDDGIFWCMTNVDEIEMSESDTRSGEVPENEKDSLITETKPFHGWKKSEQSVMSITADIINRLGVSESDVDVDPLIQGLEELWDAFLTSVSSSVRDYLSVEHLGLILQKLAELDKRKVERRLPGSLVQGTPNLILCPKADVLSTVLSIYMMDPTQPLPQADEVLMCTQQTTADQLDVFLRRALADTSNKIHCLVNSDILGFDVSDSTERRLEHYMQQNKHHELQYRLVVICSAENENRSRIITSLDKFRRPPLPIPEIRHVTDYIRKKLQIEERNAAGAVDFDNSSVRVVRSWRAGVGKTLYVKRKNEELTLKSPDHKMTDLVTIPLQEKEINVSQVTQILLSHILPPEATTPRIFHLDIAHEVQEGVDFFLFNLLILGCVTDNYGHVWRRSSRDLYLLETIPIIEKMQSQQVHYVHHIFHLLPYLTCRSPEESLNILTDEQKKPKDFRKEDQLFDEKEFRGPVFQRPYQYLSQLDKGGVIKDVNPNTPVGTPADCLKILLNNCGVPDPSWAELHHFVWFFNTQLMDLEKSIFCDVCMAEDLPGFSKFVLRFLIQMSRDFSTRSLQISEESPTTITEADQKKVEEESNHHEKNQEFLDKYQMKRKWESSAHPYLFFNPDKNTLTFLGFYVERRTGNLIDQQSKKVLEKAIMLPNLYDRLVRNGVPIQENFDSLPRKEKIERLCRVMSDRTPHDSAKTSHNLDPDETYELTTDNVKKILAIYMRFRCNIPVIIMGETGCGKTRLIKFLCGLQTPPGTKVTNMILMKVHGGTTNADIKKKVEEARQIAQQNTENYKDMYTVLFFDEANTTEAIGMIKEIMCDRSIEGKPLDACENLKFVAACNPYRKHSEDFIKRLERAGLGYHVDSEKTTDKLGRIPMRRLVYRVQPLPQSLLPLVWDFGQLNTEIEDLYIRQMVKRYIEKKKLPHIPGLIEVVSEILTASQDFMREQKLEIPMLGRYFDFWEFFVSKLFDQKMGSKYKDYRIIQESWQNECSFVSLRDVERVLDVMSWFYAQGQGKRILYDQMNRLILEANEGTEEEEMKRICLDDLTRSLVLSLGVCYHACLKNREEYRKHVAKIFKAPCNLPGGPDQMEQEISVCQNVFLENVQLEKNIARNTALKENVFMMVTSIELRIPLFLVGKPGSSKSLAKTIVADAMQGNAAHKELFRELKQVQMVSFQCSPLSTPDGIVGMFRQCAQFQKDKDLDRFVSVVVLDEVGLAEDSPRMPLKTLHPLLEDGCQGDEKAEPYKKVAFVGISNWALDPAKMNRGILVQREIPDLEELKNTAEGICSAKTQVYGLVSPFIEHLAKSYLDLFEEASEKFREFFGLRDFYSLMKMIYFFVEQTSKPPTWYQLVHSVKRNFGGLDTIDPVKTFASRLTIVDQKAESLESDPDCTPMGLVKACLYDTNKTESDSRYLLLLTENYGALAILQQRFLTRSNFITVFGSSFPSDQEYTQVCRNINRIKVCMEAGKTVVLLNLENLYESLYDALNQYYVYFGGERYVDLGLGTHRVKCRVHKDFRLIVVAEKDVVIKKFPIPLLNRLEKHVLTVNKILTEKQLKLASLLEKWVKDFSTEKQLPRHFQRNKRKQIVHSAGDVFIGYHADTCSSVILHVEKDLTDDNMILDEAKRLLLWCATPNYVVRLGECCLDQEEQEEAKKAYMKEQYHENLAEYLKLKLQKEKEQILFAQITTHSKLLSTADLSDIHHAVGISPDKIALETLQSFDTERQFSHRIRSFMDSNLKEELLLVIQCDSGDTNANLVASARYCIQDEHQQIKDRRTAPCHVVLIIQLPAVAGGCFTGFQCMLWHSVHIDDLKVQDQEMPSLMAMLGNSVGTLVNSAVDMHKLECTETDSSASASETQVRNHKLNVYNLILSCVQPALAMIRDKEETMQRSTQRIELILHLLHENPLEGVPSFLRGLSCHIGALLKEKESNSHDADSWLSNEAAKSENINRAGTFRRSCIQYLESKISPILAGIIAHIDTNHNLDIIRNNISSGDWKAWLWLHIFDTPGAIQLKYSDLQSPTKQQELREVVVKTTGCAGQMFDAVMPFSWLIYEQIDIIWRTAQEECGEEETPAKIEKIVGSLKESVLGPVLDTLVGNVSTDEIVRLYVQDFTCIVYHTWKPEEHELVVSTILKTYSTLQGNVSPGIVAGLVWIHESHHRIVQDLRYFRSINEVWPECAEAVKCKLKDPQNSDSLALVNLGLSLLIQQLSPQDLNSSKSQQKWLQGVYHCRPVIEKGLACYTFADTSKMDDAVVKAQKMWTKVIVVKLFIEHVASDEETEKYVSKYCMAIWGVLGDTPDFKKEQSLEKVEKFLKICNKTAIKDLLGQEPKCCKCERKMESIPVTLPCKDAICMQCYYEMEAIHSKECPHCSKEIPSDFDSNAPASQREVQIFKNFQSRCNSFFIDIVSQLCFANNTAPSEEVMDKLLGYITMLTPSGKSGNMETRQLTKELTIFNDCVDPNPVFRSFLLQLLIKTSTEKVTSYLEMYFKQAESMIGKDNIDLEMHMVQLCQLVVHCLEDSYYLEAAEKDSVTIATKYLESAGQEMQDSSVWMAGIYFIAKARFGMAVTAKHIHETILSNKKQTVTLQQQQMIEQAATLCEGDCKWPKNFFIKYLCRCYGQDSYEALCKNFSDTTYLGWTRYELEEIGKVREVSDRYIVCGPHYIKIREAVTRVGLGEDIDHLDSTIMDTKKEIPGNKLKILLYLTLHREITMSNLYDNNKSKVNPKAIEILQKYCSETEDLKNEDLAERILLNKYGLQSSFLNVTPGLDLKHQGVLCLLMHIDLVLRNLHGDSTILQPLVRLATQPERMKDSFIPSMPQDDVQEIREVILAHREKDENPVFYHCPNGHPYYIGNCGRAWVESKCPQCGAKIGGQVHNLLTDNKPNEGQDLTETGHILGDSELRTQCEPERSMTPVNCAVIRLLTHLTMMLGANINSQAVSEFIKPNIPKDNVPQFLWKHIEHDLDDLHRALGKSIDDVFVIMHSILSDMLEKHSENEQLEEDICSLSTKKARDDWEKRFLQKYLVPLFQELYADIFLILFLLQNIENLLKEFNEQIVMDKRLGSDPLQCLLYEVTPGQENISLTNLREIPSMWRYQSRITMDHLHHEFEVQTTATQKNQYRILGLFLKEEQHLRAIRYIPSILKLQRILFQKYQRKLAKAEASKITVELLKKELNGDEQKCLLDEYAEAWDLVRDNIETVPMDYRRERINKSTPVSWFLPALSGAGLCAYSLLTFLFRKQNNFLDHYYQEIKNSVKPRVRVRDITPAHLISYHPEKDILPLVLANCNYSFEMGKGTTIEYNFANLERQIMDRFLFGKSQINIEIELMVYRAEYTNVTVFTKLQEKIPQVPLRTAAKHKISAEFHSVPDLYQALDNLDIAISFLKSIGGNPENSLDKFMMETLKMKESLLGPKAKQICQYQHVKALWLLLSLKNTRKLAHHNQVIFEGVPDQFHQQLSNELQEQVTTFLQLLSVERLEVLLELMFECIVLVISVPQDPNDEDYVDPTNNKFKDYLFGLQETKDLNQNQDTDQDGGLKERGVDLAYELEKFPDEVFNKFCVETWKLANQCLETRRTQT